MTGSPMGTDTSLGKYRSCQAKTTPHDYVSCKICEGANLQQYWIGQRSLLPCSGVPAKAVFQRPPYFQKGRSVRAMSSFGVATAM